MFVQLPEYLSNSIGHLSGTAKFSGTSTDLSDLNLDSEIALTETTLNAVALEDSMLNCTIATGELKANGSFDGAAIDMTAPFPLGQQDVLDIQAASLNFDRLMRVANTADFGGTGTSSATLSRGWYTQRRFGGTGPQPSMTFHSVCSQGSIGIKRDRVFIEDGLLTI